MTRATVLEPRSSDLRHSCSCTRVLDAGGPAGVETPGLPRLLGHERGRRVPGHMGSDRVPTGVWLWRDVRAVISLADG